MIQLIKNILIKWGCLHQWKLERESAVYEEFADPIPIYRSLIYICTKCGKFKKIKSS